MILATARLPTGTTTRRCHVSERPCGKTEIEIDGEPFRMRRRRRHLGDPCSRGHTRETNPQRHREAACPVHRVGRDRDCRCGEAESRSCDSPTSRRHFRRVASCGGWNERENRCQGMQGNRPAVHSRLGCCRPLRAGRLRCSARWCEQGFAGHSDRVARRPRQGDRRRRNLPHRSPSPERKHRTRARRRTTKRAGILRSASSPRSGRPSSLTASSGGIWPPRARTQACRRTPRSGCRASVSWLRLRLRTPRAARAGRFRGARA